MSLKNIKNNMIWAVILVFVTGAAAQLDLANLGTQTVKQNQPWAWMDTKVNSLNVDLTVNKGVITANVEIAFTPDSGLSERWISTPLGEQWVYDKVVFMDSLETSTWFQLDPNYAVTELYLWVGAEKVRGALQERGLASAQYESIVQRRKDPALLETWGGGSYSLRVFPLQTGETRKIEIQFVGGLEDGPAGFGAVLPVINSLSYMYTPTGSTNDFRTIGSFSLTARSADGGSYSLDWPGVGTMTIGAAPQTISSQNLGEIGRGTVTDPSKSSGQNAWVGGGGSMAGIPLQTAYFGTKSILVYDELILETEPAKKLFILDAFSDDLGSLEQAKKLALLAVKNYVKENDQFNVGLAGAGGSLTWLFDAEQKLTSGSLMEVYNAIKGWRGSAAGHSMTVLENFAAGAFSGDRTVVFHISGQPYDEYPIPYPQWTNNWPADSITYARWDVGYQAWYKVQLDRANALSEKFNANRLMLFGFWNDYMLYQVANATGGFQLGGLSGYYYWYYPQTAVSAEGAIAPDRFQLYLPPLFGPERPDNSGPQNLKVTASGVPVSDLAVLYQEAYPYYFGRGGIMVDDVVMMKRSDMWSPYSWNRDSVDVRVSGRYILGGTLTLEITGTWTGLAFTKTLTLALGPISGGARVASSLWAYQRSENLRIDDYAGSVAAVQQLGRDFHVVNSQMSLLALEPGMALWEEMPTGDQSGGTNTRGGAEATSDALMAAPGNPMDLSLVSLEDILNATGIGSPLLTQGLEKTLSVIAGETVTFLVTGTSGTEQIAIEITDLQGRRMTGIEGSFTSDGYKAVWKPGQRTKGVYMVVVRLGGQQLMKKFVL